MGTQALRARIEQGFWREAAKKYHLFLFDSTSIAHHLHANGYPHVSQIVFCPIVRQGAKFRLFGHFMQALGVPGTLCVVAR